MVKKVKNLKTLPVGSLIEFTYVKEEVDEVVQNIPLKSNTLENVSGIVMDVRDLHDRPITSRTLKESPNLSRSRFLITIRTGGGRIKTFYDARMTNIRKIEKCLLRRMVEKVVDKHR